MRFHNYLIESVIPDDTADRLPFHTLKLGDRYQHIPGGNISQVVEKKEDYMMIRRHDGWLVDCHKGCFVWDKMVIKVAPLRK